MKKGIIYIIIGFIIGIGGVALANNITWNTPENLQTSKYVTADKGRDVPLIQIFCELKKGNSIWCKWDYELKRYTLTCKGLERLFSYDIEGDKYGNYKCVDKLEEMKNE